MAGGRGSKVTCTLHVKISKYWAVVLEEHYIPFPSAIRVIIAPNAGDI
jgi:hypothetical protein